MAPRELPKETPKVQRTIVKPNTTRKPSLLSSATTAATIKKTMSSKKSTENTPRKVKKTVEPQKTPTRRNTPIPKEKEIALTGSVKKSWKARRPKPAHSGVPVPEKMKKLFALQNKKALVEACDN